MTTGQPDNMQVSQADAVGDAITFKRVGVLYHPHKPESQVLGEEIVSELRRRGMDPWLGLSRDDETLRGKIGGLDLIIVLGGDGSMLRAARVGAGHDTPILGLNMGRIGFLSEMTPDNWRESLSQVFDGRFWLEERMMLEAVSRRDDEVLGRHLALNDVVVSRGSLARVVHLKTHVDGDYLTTYVADGLIVSTPTGSTAYALAVGGPILPPELHNIVVIPIAPHLSLDRAVVLAEGSTVSMHVSADHQAILTVDGQFEFELRDGDQVEVCASQHACHFVRLSRRSYFYRTLLARLEPKR